MPSILDRYFFRELVRAIGAVVVVLLLISTGGVFAQVLQQVANGSYPASILFQVLGLRMIDGLSALLPLAAFLGTMLGLGRMYRESEMHVLASAGLGPWGVLRPVTALGLLCTLLVGGIALWGGPWASRTADAMVDEANKSVIAAGLDAGRFTELPGKGGTIFTDALSRDGSRLGNAFVAADRIAKDGTLHLKMITAKQGLLYQESNGNGRYLRFNDGWQYEIPKDGDNWRAMQYQSNDTVLSPSQDTGDEDPVHSLGMSALMQASDPAARAELAWRIAVPISVGVLLMLAVPLSRQHPREPRYGRLILAILGFFIYYNLQVLGRGQLQRGHWHNPSALWLIDGIVFVWGAWLFRNQYVERRVRKRAD